MKRLTTEDFILKSNAIHNNLYNYSKVQYINKKTKVCIICTEHGEFWQTPNDHMYSKSGCPICANNIKLTTTLFITRSNKMYNNKYDYTNVVYKNNTTKVKIVCPIHGEFEQIPKDHLRGHGCFKCGKMPSNDIIEKKHNLFIENATTIHNNKYDYTNVDYNRIHDKVKIVCPIHGEFEQEPNNHVSQEQGCPKCSNNVSKNEKSLLKFIKDHCDHTVLENTRTVLYPNELDIYIPTLKLAFEFNGLYWHNELYKDAEYHLTKTNACEDKGIHLIHIYEDDWNLRQDIVKSRILNLLNKTPNIVYGRNVLLQDISYKESEQFLKENHIQGNCMSKYRYGLYYKTELISVMTFGKLRKCLGTTSEANEYELLRFCNKKYYTVVGGASKLFKHFLKEIHPEQVISYANRSWTMNNTNTLYNKLNFSFDHITKPNYFYIVNKERENRFKYRKDVLVSEGFDKNKTEHSIMLERKIYRIYNSGQIKFKYIVKNY